MAKKRRQWRPPKDIKPVQFYAPVAHKKAARAALRGTPYSLSDYLRCCLADLAQGRVRIAQKRAKPP
jgi:hypothetical protein